MLKFIIFSIVSVSFFSLMLNNISLRFANMRLTEDLLKSFVNYNIILEKGISQESEKIEQNDGFLKFVSDSRDWAYAYIEEVQEGLNKFINDLEPEISYFKEYGDIGSMAPNYYSMKKITGAYEELKKFLPNDYGKIDT
jgi:hypothetical protein